MTAKNHWYVVSTGNHQGLIVEETTGANIAATYNKHDAPLVAAAPELLEALERCQIRLFMLEGNCDEYELARKAIAKAKGPRNIIDPAGNNSIAAMMRRSRGEE